LNGYGLQAWHPSSINFLLATACDSLSQSLTLVSRFVGLGLSLCLLTRVVEAPAQQVFAPPPVEPDRLFGQTPSVLREPTSGSAAAPVSRTEYSPLQWGPIRARLNLSYRFTYGDGIQPTPGKQLTTAYQLLSPGVLFDLGKHWILDYTPGINIYSNKEFRDSVSQSVSLSAHVPWQDWIFGFSQGYQSSSQPLIETGTQTDTETYSTHLSASYSFNSRLALELGASQSIQSAQQFSNSREWSTLDWLNYQPQLKVAFALGVGLGYIDLEQGSDVRYEKLLGRVSLPATEKIDFIISGGADLRHFVDSEIPDKLTPTYEVTLNYRPFEVTSVSLHAHRGVKASYFESQLTENTDLSVGLRQRLLGKFYLDIGPGYTFTDYFGTTSGSAVNRSDNYWFVGARLSCTFLRRGRLAVFYQISKNSSNEEGFSYNSSQVGFEVNYSL
jgi:putative beta-barrel porin BBP2